MAKFANDLIMDAALDFVISNCDSFAVCAGEPADYGAATTLNSQTGGNQLGSTSVSSSDFTKANGDTSGRKVTVSGQSGITVDADGTADHVALLDDTNSRIILTTILPSQGVTSGGEMTTDPFDEEIEDPS
jgi:hypothetical protein